MDLEDIANFVDYYKECSKKCVYTLFNFVLKKEGRSQAVKNFNNFNTIAKLYKAEFDKPPINSDWEKFKQRVLEEYNGNNSN